MEDKDANLPEIPKGLLSMLYWVLNSEEIHEEFHEDMLATMRDRFGLDADAEVTKLMMELREVHSNEPEVVALLTKLCTNHLIPELVHPPKDRNFW